MKPIETGDLGTDPVLFRSKDYEIGQNVKVPFHGKNKFPDVYVKYKDQLKSIIQIKIILGGGTSQIDREVSTFELMRKAEPNLNGLFISYVKDNFTEEKRKRLEDVGYKTLILQKTDAKIRDVFIKSGII